MMPAGSISTTRSNSEAHSGNGTRGRTCSTIARSPLRTRYKSADTAWNYQILIRNYLRFKPYTDCRGNEASTTRNPPLSSAESSWHIATG
jgi:hypothetical protein